jgi:hypothetical protein
MTYKQAKERLDKEYKLALERPFVHDPVAYALYQAWKAADLDREKREKDGESK